jgi:alkanesulfonate monooxygenase SsuD/methylene tetrahydromethanopterin reductase-like flavin-dependent oxidoreductase (luciferase family)
MRGLKVMDKYWERVDQLGVDRNPYRGGFLQLVCVSDSDASAEREYAEHVDYFFNRCLHVANGFADAPGYRTEATIRAGVLAQVGKMAELMRFDLKWKDFVEQGYVIAGSPATVAERMESMVKRMNLGHLMVLCQIGSMPKDLTLKNTQLFAEHVLPRIKPLWEDKWKDDWWIHPAREKARPGEAVAR